MSEIKLPWSVDRAPNVSQVEEQYEILRLAPAGAASFRVCMTRALADVQGECLGCMLRTPRVIAVRREGEGEWRTIRLCDFCFELVRKIGFPEFHGV